jgi:hypothetical protein
VDRPTHDLFLVFLTNRAFDPKIRDSLRELKLVGPRCPIGIRLVPRLRPGGADSPLLGRASITFPADPNLAVPW